MSKLIHSPRAVLGLDPLLGGDPFGPGPLRTREQRRSLQLLQSLQRWCAPSSLHRWTQTPSRVYQPHGGSWNLSDLRHLHHGQRRERQTRRIGLL